MFGKLNKNNKKKREEKKQQEIEQALLEACGEEPCSGQKVQHLVGQYKDAVKAKNDDGERPLHIVCFKGASLEIVEYIYRAWPYGLRAKSNRNWIPLHSACFGTGTLSVIQYLVQHWKESVQMLDNRQRLPLHLACFRGAPLNIIQFLAEQWPESLQKKDNGGSLVLHLACDNKAPLEVVQWLVNEWPDSVKEPNNYGSLPLHRACFSGAPPDVIQYLIQQYPEACQKKTNDGDLPLHLASGSGAPLPVIKALVETWPESVKSKDSEGKTPLDMAQQPFTFYKPSPQVVMYLQQQVNPQQADVTSSTKTVPHDNQVRRSSVPPPAGLAPPVPNRTKSMPGRSMRKEQSPRVEKAPPVPYVKERHKIKDVVVGKRDKPVSVPTKYADSIILRDSVLGRGFFGVVSKAYDPVIHEEFAVKRMDRELLIGGSKEEMEKVKRDFKREQKALLQYRHPNLALLYAYAISDHRKGHYLLYELAEKGSLDIFWQSELGRERLANFPRRVQIALNAFIGLRFLHLGNPLLRPTFHRDIKSANIVLQKDMTAQLIDVGLATFVHDSGVAASTGVKGTRGYVCPKYCTGAISFEAACDIFSFGVVLAELWSGRLQNHRTSDGRTYNFYEEYIDEEERLMEDDLDKSLGFGVTDDLPKYMRDFKDLTLSCMARNPNRRPSGEEVMNRLERIWQASKQAFFLDELSEDGSKIDDDDGTLNDALQLVSQVNDESVEEYTCRFCRTYANEVGCDECPMCLALQQERIRVSKAVSDKLLANAPAKKSFHTLRQENRSLHHIKHDKHQTGMPLVARLDLRLNNQIPRLFVLVPADLKMGWKNPKTWLRRHVATKYHLFFICCHTYQVIRPPIKLVVSKVWVEKMAPVLGVSLTLLRMAAKKGAKISLHLGNAAATMMDLSSEQLNEMLAEPGTAMLKVHSELELNVDRISEMLDEVKDILDKKDDREGHDILDHVRSGKRLSDHDLDVLNGDAYELVVEKAREDRWWRSAMDPVRKKGDDSVLWVSKSAAYDRKNEYEIVPT